MRVSPPSARLACAAALDRKAARNARRRDEGTKPRRDGGEPISDCGFRIRWRAHRRERGDRRGRTKAKGSRDRGNEGSRGFRMVPITGPLPRIGIFAVLRDWGGNVETSKRRNQGERDRGDCGLRIGRAIRRRRRGEAYLAKGEAESRENSELGMANSERRPRLPTVLC